MKIDRFLRLAVGLLLLLVFVIAIAAILFMTESALNVWDRLLAGPRIILYGYVGLMLALTVAALWLSFRLLVKRKPRKQSAQSAPLDKEGIEARLRDAEAAGIDVEDARAELKGLAARQASKQVHLCFFGEISTGKSSLIKALIPDANVSIDVVGGSTTDIKQYRWRDADGFSILLVDVPGSGGHDGDLDVNAKEEAERAQIVLFVCDGDLTRAESASVERLLALDKPLIVVMNKADRYRTDEQASLMSRLLERIDSLGGNVERDRVVAVSAGGETQVIEKAADGSERPGKRQRPADIGVLVVAINRLLDENAAGALDLRRDRAVFRLAAEKLADAEREYREQRAQQIIRNSTRKAVVGALAAISPGTDIVIQGYVGTTMTRELCRLYGAAPRDLDIEEFLTLSQSRAGKVLPLSLAVAGNGLKAFPGVGTVAGGLVHAVAYGLIFDALGRSLVLTLKKHGELDPGIAAREFEEGIGDQLEAGVTEIARLALETKQKRRD